ncbi:MAG: ATP-dependent zinc protease [Bacteroidota bacterium]|jgi:hypothetical protein
MWSKTPDQFAGKPRKKKKRERPKLTAGRREKVDFPDLGLFGLTAKLDTGAYTTALHCSHVRIENGVLIFRLLDETHPEYQDREHHFSEFDRKQVRNSFGEEELRYIVRTRICMGSRTIKSIVSLSDRGNMRYPVLIGRRLLHGRFLVDVSLENALEA